MSRRAAALLLLLALGGGAVWFVVAGGAGPDRSLEPPLPAPEDVPADPVPSPPGDAAIPPDLGPSPAPAGRPTPDPLRKGAPTDPSAIEGTVVDAKTGAPLGGAVVSAARSDPACRRPAADPAEGESGSPTDPLPPIDVPPPDAVETTTGPDGRFRLEWTEKFPADVVARKAGYGFGCAAGTMPGRRLVLRAAAGGTVRGTVRRADGRGVSGAIATLRAAAGEGTKAGPLLDATTTDREGAFEFRGVAPGRYALRLRHASSMPATLEPLEPSPRAVTLVLSPALAVWLEVASDEGGIPAGSLAVWRLDGPPWREGRVPLTPVAAGPRPAPEGAAWALVLVPCERAQATLSLSAPGFRPWSAPPLALPAEGGSAEVSVRLERDPSAATLRLALEDASGRRVRFDEGRVRASVRDARTGAVVEGAPDAESDPWTMRGLPAGAYRVELASPLAAPAVVEVDLRAGDDVERTVRLAAPAKLRVRIEAPGKRRVRFRVLREGAPVPAFEAGGGRGAGPASLDAPTFFADANGVVVTGLAAGEVTVEVLSPDLLADPVTVRVVEGETKDVSLATTPR